MIPPASPTRALTLPRWRERWALAAGQRRGVVVHASETWAQSVGRGDFGFVENLAQVVAQSGMGCWLLRAESRAARAALQRRAGPLRHLLIGSAPHRGAWDFHILPAYVPGFWLMDPHGVHAAASIARAEFDPATVDPTRAAAFFARLQREVLGQNRSTFDQAPRGTALPAATAAVFVQDIDDWRRPVHYLDTETLLGTVADACAGGLVLVKLHPRQKPERAALVRRIVAARPGLTLTEASVHDVVAAAAVTVCQSSATGFEALLQRRAVISCAATDYHHACTVAHSPAGLRAALAGAAASQAARFDHARYLWWYLAHHCLEPAAPDFAARLATRLSLAHDNPPPGC